MLNFIVNPNAAGAKGYGCWKKLERSLLKKKIEYQVFLTWEAGAARELSRSLTVSPETGGQILVVVGGDGTMNEVLDGTRLSTAPVFGFIPVGGDSELARVLGLPRGPLACLNRVLSPKTLRFLEYGVLSYEDPMPRHRRFLIRSGCGFDALLLGKLREQTERRGVGNPLLRKVDRRLMALRTAHQLKTTKARLILDGERKMECNHLFLLNAGLVQTGMRGEKTGGFPSESSGIAIRLLQNRSKAQLLRAVLTPGGCFSGRIPDYRSYNCRELSVALEEDMPLHVDGEPCGFLRAFSIRIVRQKLRFLC